MTVHYTLTFLLLAAEMVTFCFLVAPLPYTVRKKLFKFLSESPIIAKIAYALKISFIFVGILFVDALQRMFRVTADAESMKAGPQGAVQDVRTDIAARKFYSQRNTYLTGFTLFLSLVLTRTFYIMLDLIHTQEEFAKLKKSTQAGDADELAKLRQRVKELEAEERDFSTLKRQASQNAKEYDRLADELIKATGSKSDKRKD
ncbi:endoplasmic reticulum protein [Coprinopsis cinerea okayama7|uniref:Endoplasmic reticulum transmembrane protein n=1 Tax=Coprinopsis cinerea (strain Okayama-7 / 130 / ATCC MYA-4618 / FGSC 9003) TaxID=240176 RepID=A8NIF1_COPC7|nr:endoplasmic reticulum protein [Coprinopsis cinerea okayama7\|eukprot:XP_001833986.1 endoplasmic reticulum protein [Coprinopsis cinerea okayama7\